MIESFRELLYPLGFLSSMMFGIRVLMQWVNSEMQGKSVVTKGFWKVSLLGNVLLMLHSFIQVQFHVCIVQACNAVISWRNLNLMKPAHERASLRNVLIIFFIMATATLTAFFLQDYFLMDGEDAWFRLPVTYWHNPDHQHISAYWHLFGFIGLILFSCRFWVQWWCAEKHQTSYLGPAFWWISLSGEFLCLVYFVRIVDPVNLIGPAFGLIPYIRNLILINKSKRQTLPGNSL